MRKLLIPILMLALLLTGCSSWLDGEYHSVKPHASDGIKLPEDVVTVSSYQQVRDALEEMVISGKLKSTFYIDGFDLETNFTAAVSCFNNIGPGLGAVGPSGNYSEYSFFSKAVLSAAMLLGRLEIFPLLLCFSPSTWLKK